MSGGQRRVMASNTTQAPEIACVFGSQCQLTGVYTAPSGAHEDQPCAVYLTADLLHHIGPSRLHVELARHLASQGIAGLRFDLSGAGDSEPGSLAGNFRERSIREVREAMDYLQAHHGQQRFVLVGLSSGADDALATAQQDPRVAGAVLLNGYAYPAGHFRFYRTLKLFLRRLLMWQALRNRVTGSLQRLMPESRTALVGEAVSADADAAALSGQERMRVVGHDDNSRDIPPQEETARVLERLCQAEADLLFVYTGSEHDTYAYEGQLGAMFPGLRDNPHLSERYIQEADHTLVLKDDRAKVIGWIGEWFRQAAFKRRCL